MSDEKSEVRVKLLKKLPPRSRRLLEKLEDFTGKWISFAIQSEAEEAPAALALHHHEVAATVLVRLDDARVAQGATHELLHLRRWWLEGVPLLYHGVSDVKARCEQLENELEHQVIVPREADYGFDPFARWNGVYGEKWRGQPFSLFEERAVVRQSCMMDWLGSNLITDERAVMLMEQKIKEMGFLEEADDFSRGVRRRLHDKAQTVAFLCKCMGYAEGVVRLRIYNAVAGTISEEAVPSLSAN